MVFRFKILAHYLNTVWLLQSALSTVDVLCSFAAFTATVDGPTSRPRFVDSGPEGQAILEVKGLWHPCAVTGASGGLVPNDLTLGTRLGLRPQTWPR